MAKIIEGQRDPARLAAEKRTAAVKAAREKLAGQRFLSLPPQFDRDILLLLLQAAGLADENGVLLPPE